MKRILTILALLFLTSKALLACSCIGKSTVEVAYKSADIVISGKVLSSTKEYFPDSASIKEMVALGFPADKLDKRLNGHYLTKVLVKVKTVFKGQVLNKILTIYTGIGSGDCGYNFKIGHKYIIYGRGESYFGGFLDDQNLPSEQSIYWTNICTRTQEYNLIEKRELEKVMK